MRKTAAQNVRENNAAWVAGPGRICFMPGPAAAPHSCLESCLRPFPCMKELERAGVLRLRRTIRFANCPVTLSMIRTREVLVFHTFPTVIPNSHLSLGPLRAHNHQVTGARYR